MSPDEKDARLRQEIQLLGRLLGEVIRTTNGDVIYARIEHIRKLAVALRRQSGGEDLASLRS